MRARDLATLVTLTVLVFVLFTTTVTAGKKIVNLDDRGHALDFSKTVPGQLNYQGLLANASDSSTITATLEMTFRLFDSETKGTELWSETHPAVDVQGGLFQVLLGSVTDFPTSLFDGNTRWLQTEVGAEVLAPRKPLVSTAYSHRADDADHAAQADDADQLEGYTVMNLDDRWVNQEDLDHLDAADGDPTDAVYVDDAGKVGIGTASPLTELDVDGSVNATTYYGDGSHLTGISGTTDNDWTIAGDDIYHQTGNVGIGTSSPSARLDVSGSINTDSLYKIGGDPVLSTQGTQNVLAGIDAGMNNTGNHGTFLGYHAGWNNQAHYNVFIGCSAGASNTTGVHNTFLGCFAGQSNTEGDMNVFLGKSAGYNQTTGHRNTFVGSEAGYHNTEGYLNTFIGGYAGHDNETGDENTFLGSYTGLGNTTGHDNTFLGCYAGNDNTTGNFNTFVGNGAGIRNTEAILNTFIGYSAGYSNTTGDYNTFLGSHSGHSNTTADHNTFIGYFSGYNNELGCDNTFLGLSAGSANTEGNSNTFLGTYAGNSNETGDHNTFVGRNAGHSNTTSDYNTFIGKDAGFYATGQGNVFLGFRAGYDETGSDKLYIANGSGADDLLIYGDFSTGRVGVGTTAPTEELSVSGNVYSSGYVRVGSPSSSYDSGDIVAADDLVADDDCIVGDDVEAHDLIATNSFKATSGSGISDPDDNRLEVHDSLHVYGAITKSGTCSDVMKTQTYGHRLHYADESTEVYHFDRGRGQLQDGETIISLDPVFLETVTIDGQYPSLVQITLTADCQGVYVAEQTATYFKVKELMGGASDATFNWELAAKRKGYESTRLEQVEDLEEKPGDVDGAE